MKDLERIALEKKITALSKALANLGKGGEKDLRELMLLIRKPGWTTIAELGFTMGMLDVMNQQVKILSSLKSTLVKTAKQVG